jgi:hypothetical protein
MNRREVLGSVGAALTLPAFAVQPQGQASPLFLAALRLGPAQDGTGNHRWAEIVAGKFSGELIIGRVQSGRIDWFVDPASGAVEVAISCIVLRADGTTIQMCDRTASATVQARAALPGHPTAPVLCDASGSVIGPPLVGRMYATAIWRGFVSVRAFPTA